MPDHVKEQTDDWRECRKAASDMSPENRSAYAFYKQCKAVNKWPDDPIVDWYSGLIRELEDAYDRTQADRNFLQLSLLVELAKIRA